VEEMRKLTKTRLPVSRLRIDIVHYLQNTKRYCCNLHCRDR
jgi:hypothetical protein